MNAFFVAVAVIALIAIVNWLRESVLEWSARPLSRADYTVAFPFSVTLTIKRTEVPFLHQSGVYDAVSIQRNPYAFELRLVNTTDPKILDPFYFYVPLDQTTLRGLAKVLSDEADRLDKDGSPHWK